MRIKRVLANNRKKCFLIETQDAKYEFPYQELTLKPSKEDPLHSVDIDHEIGGAGILYTLASGKSDTVLLEQVRHYNSDPEVLREHLLYRMTVTALDALKLSGVSKRQLARRLKTSPRQLYRLLDTAFYGKTIDQMLKLLTVLGYKVEFNVKKRKVA